MDREIIEILNRFWQDFLKILPSLSIALLILIIFFFFGNKVNRIAKRRLYSRTNDALLSNFLGRITKWIFLIIGFVVSMEVLGLATLASGIITGAGLTAIILGFAFKNIGENFLSGLLLAFNRPFKVGDLILTEGYTGTITSLDFRTTNIKTADGHDVFIPNSMIINNPLTNFTREGFRRFDFVIQIDFDNDIEKAKELIFSSVIKVNEVLKEPAPIVVIDQLTSSVNLKAYFWINALTTERTILEVKGETIELSKKELASGGIKITELTQIKITNESIPIRVKSKKR